MKLVPVVVVGILAAGAGVLAYERWGAPSKEASGPSAGGRAEVPADYARVQAERRMARVREALGKMNLGLDDAQVRRVLAILARCFEARARILADPAMPTWSEQEFERRYRGAIEPAMAGVREAVGAGQVAEAIVTRFIYDGRPIRRPDASKDAAPPLRR